MFDYSIMLCIVLNMLQMAIAYEGSSLTYDFVLQIFNYIFTSVFIIEAVLKLIAFRLSYFKSNWNRFDFMVVLSSIADIAVSQLA